MRFTPSNRSASTQRPVAGIAAVPAVASVAAAAPLAVAPIASAAPAQRPLATSAPLSLTSPKVSFIPVRSAAAHASAVVLDPTDVDEDPTGIFTAPSLPPQFSTRSAAAATRLSRPSLDPEPEARPAARPLGRAVMGEIPEEEDTVSLRPLVAEPSAPVAKWTDAGGVEGKGAETKGLDSGGMDEESETLHGIGPNTLFAASFASVRPKETEEDSDTLDFASPEPSLPGLEIAELEPGQPADGDDEVDPTSIVRSPFLDGPMRDALPAPREAGAAATRPGALGVRLGASPPRVPAPDDEPPALQAPRMVSARVGGADPESGAAAIQILGVGKARAVTPTLALGESETDEIARVSPSFAGPEDSETEGLSLTFEEPDEVQAPAARIPQLTDDDDRLGSTLPAHTPMAGPSEGEIQRWLGRAREAEGKGDLQGAILFYTDLIGLQPDVVQALLGRGRCQTELGDYGAAMSDFQKAEDLAPKSAAPILEMGNLFFARKEYRRAIDHFDNAIAIDGNDAMAWCRRGICHHYRKNHKQAFQDLQRAKALNADIPNLRQYIKMVQKAMEGR